MKGDIKAYVLSTAKYEWQVSVQENREMLVQFISVQGLADFTQFTNCKTVLLSMRRSDTI
jgi:hypothetical protein